MTSILTNVAANTALLNLENTNSNLQNIQNQISTGFRVSSAADNAAYYSIATVLRSDSSALSTVSDALNLGSSSLDVACRAVSDPHHPERHQADSSSPPQHLASTAARSRSDFARPSTAQEYRQFGELQWSELLFRRFYCDRL